MTPASHKSITWLTITAAVCSALLLAVADFGFIEVARVVRDGSSWFALPSEPTAAGRPAAVAPPTRDPASASNAAR